MAMTVNLPDLPKEDPHVSEAEWEHQIRLMAALKLFELGKMTSGHAAILAGVSRGEFFELCSRYRVPLVNDEHDSLEEELARDRDAALKAES